MIIAAPYGQKMRNGKVSAKQYPVEWWRDVLGVLRDEGREVVQIGVAGEEVLTERFLFNRSLAELGALVESCATWVSVDSFLPHLARHHGKRGVVIWGPSDPLIFGYSENVNLLKDRKYLRRDQFNIWEPCEYNREAFVTPDVVLNAVRGLL